MKKTNQKRKPGILWIFSSVLIGSFVSVTAASAQTSSGVLQSGSVQPTQQINRQDIVNENSSNPPQTNLVPTSNKVPLMVNGQNRTAPYSVPTSASPASGKQHSAPASIEQLKYMRKQAAQKGQSTESFDKAIEEQIRNLAN